MRRLFRTLLRLALFLVSGAWLADRWLRDRAGGGPPAPIRTSVIVDAPIERVWAVVADVERQPEWMHDLREIRLTTPPPVGLGTRGVGRVRVLGIALDDPVEVTAFEPPTRYAIRHEGLVKGGGEIRLAPGADETTTIVTWDETLVPPVLPHLGAFVLGAVFEPIFQRDLERLAALVEAGDDPGDAG
ncbi:MAG: hypothetical protein C0498_09940 [Anaerolinea sp.]|nr:hypothetical protein [Anaerolinea sp.]